MELKKGRPQSRGDRLQKEIDTYDLLDKLGISFERIDHPAADTMEVCREIDKSLGALICKNLMLCNRQKTSFYILMMPADKVFKTKELSAQINSSRLSFAPSELMEELVNITPGSLSVMGLMYDVDNKVSLLVDEDVLNSEYLGCHPCINTSSIKLKIKDVFEKFLPAVHHTYKTIKLTGE